MVILRRLNDILKRVHQEQDESFGTFFKSEQLRDFLSDVVSNSDENRDLLDMLCEGINWNDMAQPLFQSLIDPIGRIGMSHGPVSMTALTSIEPSSHDAAKNISSVVGSMDELSLPFCICLIRTGRKGDIAQYAGILLNAIVQSATSADHVSFQVLEGLDKPLREKVSR